MAICPKCSKDGYLVQEKIRKKHEKKWWSTRIFGNKKHKEYESAKRKRHHYWSFVHNIKRGGKWTITKCYIGIMPEKQKNCSCSYCK